MADSLRDKALSLLARRDYSRLALARKLAPLAESAPEGALESLLDDLVARQLLSDVRYAANRARARGQRYGDSRLAGELLREGLPPEEIETALALCGGERERCQAVWQKKFGAPPADPREQAKQARFLRYRGFSSDSIRQVLRNMESDDES
ncbi:MAG: recombination regulator RecX [Zoogloeaceae bacterium]|jgi:regulatory protein|nr:recombination regulator RecX [Zoogloeaceae bacterium]